MNDFKYSNTGFSAVADLSDTKDDKLMFFSVPFEKGWSAEVNGESADIEKSSIGFMAVRVKGGQLNEISFTYKTPGLGAGMIISAAAVAAFIIYMIFFKNKRRTAEKRAVFIVKCKGEGSGSGGNKAHKGG